MGKYASMEIWSKDAIGEKNHRLEPVAIYPKAPPRETPNSK
jgi:hypothetical protein